MSQYDKLALVYDYLMGGVDYQAWVDYIFTLCHRFNLQPHSVVDLACGTGSTTLPLAEKGLKAYGVDIAAPMLEIAREKARSTGLDVAFLEQDMCRLTVPDRVDLITCYHDGINYITEPENLKLLFARVKEALQPHGLFIFDLVNVHKLSRADGETTFADDEGMSLIWQSWYHKDRDIWEINLTGFIKQGQLYEKFQETHREKAYTQAEIIQYLAQAGLEIKGVFHSYTLQEPHAGTYRYFFVAAPV